jgi:peptidoglycan hydrolase-like protein with peptidoglycan-binding domain
MLRRWALAAALLACLGAGLSVRAASAEDFTFSAPVTGMGNWLFEGPLDVHDGKFQQTFVSGNARLQVWGTVDGDHVSMGGQVKVTGFYEQGNAFRIEGKFRGETFNGKFVETLNYGQALRGQVTMTRPVAKAAPTTTAPAQQAVVSTPKQTTTPPVQQNTQPTPAAPTPESLEPKLSAAQRQGVQKQLTVLGFYNRAIDGSLGPGTRDAIRKFQQAYDLAPTGYLDAKEIRILKEAAAAKEKELAAAAAQQAEQQATAKNLADEKAAQEKAEADRKAADAQAQALAAQLEKDRQALEAQKAELKRQQEELAKSQQHAAEAPKETATAATPPTDTQEQTAATPTEAPKETATTTTAPATSTQEQATAAATPTESTTAAVPPAAPSAFAPVLATLQPIDEVYVATKPAKIRNAPNVAAARVGTLNVGDKIQVLGRLPGQDWFLVARDDQPIGYVVASQLASESEVTRATPGAAAATGQAAAPAETAPAATQQAALPPELANLDYGTYHALVIGNDMYRSLPRLGTAVGDAEAVAKELERNYHFNVRLLTNASEEDIIGALTDMRRDLGWNDNLLIYYAGHGWYDQDAEQGYWLPVDASEDNQAHWISNADITNALKALKAKHILVVADSCYSGTLARSANISLRGIDYIERIVKKKARTVLTSGGLEPVLDAGGEGHSVFAHAFLAALDENDGVMDGQELFRRLRDPVVANAPQTPEYGEIRGAGHDGGDFIFVRR